MSRKRADGPDLPPLPESLKRRLPPGVTLFSRPEQRRWVMALAPEWKQTRLPKEIVRPDAAFAFVLSYLEEHKLNPGAVVERNRVEGPDLDWCADKWLDELEEDDRCAPATFKGHKSHLKCWIRPKFGKTALAALDVPMARAWAIELRKAKENGRTVSHMWSTFTSLYDFCMAEGYVKVVVDDPWLRGRVNILRHPVVLAELPEMEDSEPHPIPLRIVRPLVKATAVELRNRARYMLAATGGYRDGEIAGIKIKRLDLDGNEDAPPTVEIVQSLALVGAKVGVAYAKPKKTKTKSSNRKGPLHRAAVAAIREWLTEGWPSYVGRQPGPEDYLFPRPDGQPSRPKSARELRDDLERAGLPTELDGRPFEFKDFRATFATTLEEAGAGEKIIKRLMGHKPVGVTEMHYTKRELRTMEATVALIELEWEGGLPPFRPFGDEAREAPRRHCGRRVGGVPTSPSAAATQSCTVQPSVQVCTETADSSMISAPPARVERTTFGLGIRLRVHRYCGLGPLRTSYRRLPTLATTVQTSTAVA